MFRAILCIGLALLLLFFLLPCGSDAACVKCIQVPTACAAVAKVEVCAPPVLMPVPRVPLPPACAQAAVIAPRPLASVLHRTSSRALHAGGHVVRAVGRVATAPVRLLFRGCSRQ